MEFSNIFVWYIFLFLFGIIGLPVTNKLFPKFKDKGYGLSKAVGLVIFGLPIWLLCSFHILSFQSPIIIYLFAIAVLVSFVVLGKQKFRPNKYMIFQEVAFFMIFFVWCAIRSVNARIEGTEKFMNIAFMNSIARSEFFPPRDPWFTPESINYYYMGHFFFTLISKLTLTPIAIGYNLALNTVIGLLFISLNSIFFTIFSKIKPYKALILGAFISFLISFGGNLHYFYHLLESTIKGEPFTYFFPDATRIISYTINEYPSYSVVLGDLHGHYSSLPFFLIMIAISFIGISIPIYTRRKLIFNSLVSIFIVVLFSINSWDFVTANIIFGLIHFYQIFSEDKLRMAKHPSLKFIKTKDKKMLTFIEIVLRFFYLIVVQLSLNLVGVLIMLPYILNFKPAVGGIGIVPWEIKSELGPWLLFWGTHLVVLGISLFFIFKRKFKKNPNDNWIFFIILAAVALIIGVELIFLKDLFYEVNFNYFRTNTVFKFYYHAWILLGIGAGYLVYKIFSELNLKNKIIVNIISTLFVILYLASIVYVGKAVTDFYDLSKFGKSSTLDGNAYIYGESPGDFYTINWIKQNVEGQPVVLEAVGEAYTYYSRISANTGLVTPLGWPTHEWQWRKNISFIDERKADIKNFYQTKEPREIRRIAEKYQIEYVMIGDQESKAYGYINETLLTSFSDVVFSFETTKLLKLNYSKFEGI